MKLRKFLGFLIPAGVALISLKFIEPEIRHQRFKNHSQLFLSNSEAYKSGRGSLRLFHTGGLNFIKVKGEDGYNTRRANAAWEEAEGRYRGAKNKGNTSLDILLKTVYTDWQDWVGDIDIPKLMRICDRLWKNKGVQPNMYPERTYRQDTYEFNAAHEWCVDATKSRPRWDTTMKSIEDTPINIEN